MTKQAAKQRIKKLREEINHHRYLYHVKDVQEISDAAHDSLKKELEEIERQYPDLVTPDSPTQRVGGQPLPEFTQHEHRSRMLSLQDVFDAEELAQWEKRNQKIVPADYEYFVELKIDGVAVSLVYEDGLLLVGATRGDGLVGEDVTHNVKTINAIPLSLRQRISGRLEVRGEVYILKDDFAQMNEERKKEGKQLFANPRNIAAGSIRQLDPGIAAARPLRFFAWEITGGMELSTREQEYEMLQELGFAVPPGAKTCDNLGRVSEYIALEEEKRLEYPFLVDGLVVKVNDLTVSGRLGVVGKAPRGSIAYKFAAEEATTVVENIVVQVGRTGALTPVAHLKPVKVAGTTVSRATLHNLDEVQRKDVRIGDTVIVRKAGDIIPEVVQSLPKLRPRDAKAFVMPDTCPVCGSDVVHAEGEVVVRCTNQQCFSRQREVILHAIGRSAFDIEGLGERIVEQMLQAGLIEEVPDLWELTQGDLQQLEGFAEKSAHNLVSEIDARREVSLSRFLIALGMPNVGTVTAQDMARSFRTLERILKADVDELEQIEGIGKKVAKGIVDFLRRDDIQGLIKHYADVGVVVKEETQAGPLVGKTFVFTGSLNGLTRDEAKQQVISAGGRVASAVGKTVDYIVVGEDPGSKAAKGKKLGITMLSVDEFRKLIAS